MTKFMGTFGSKAATDEYRKGHDRIWPKPCHACDGVGAYEENGMEKVCFCEKGKSVARTMLNDDGR